MNASRDEASIDDIVDYVLYLDGLKAIQRQSRLVGGGRRENSAEHSWHVALFGLLMGGRTAADLGKVVQMLLVHDLVEIHANDDGEDIYTHAVSREEMERREQEGAEVVFGAAPPQVGAMLRSLWDEFRARETLEAQVAHAIDRAQPILLNVSNGGDVWHRQGTAATKVADVVAFVRDTDPKFHEFLLGVLAHAELSGFFPQIPEA